MAHTHQRCARLAVCLGHISYAALLTCRRRLAAGAESKCRLGLGRLAGRLRRPCNTAARRCRGTKREACSACQHWDVRYGTHPPALCAPCRLPGPHQLRCSTHQPAPACCWRRKQMQTGTGPPRRQASSMPHSTKTPLPHKRYRSVSSNVHWPETRWNATCCGGTSSRSHSRYSCTFSRRRGLGLSSFFGRIVTQYLGDPLCIFFGA